MIRSAAPSKMLANWHSFEFENPLECVTFSAFVSFVSLVTIRDKLAWRQQNCKRGKKGKLGKMGKRGKMGKLGKKSKRDKTQTNAGAHVRAGH